MKTSGVYIHIPFCARKCSYCDFLSFEVFKTSGALVSKTSGALPPNPRSLFEKSDAKTLTFEAYTCRLIDEIESARFLGGVDTVYIGGGTPTALPSFLLCEILKAVGELPLLPGAEISVEANPGTLTPEYLGALKEHGVTRLSIGLQTTHDRLLRTLGRLHSRADFIENFRAAREAGFDNINIDLMFALPGQTAEQWNETLAEVISLSPEHISAYSLTPAENTALWEQLERGGVVLPSDETDRGMYGAARHMLAEAGYRHYELSNFARPGFESRHNINCWKMRPYIGFGLGAHSFDGRTRWRNAENPEKYLNRPGKEDVTELTDADLMSETIILGLRLLEGVPETCFGDCYKGEILRLVADGLIVRRDGRIALTPLGLDLANRVFLAFLGDDSKALSLT